MTIMSHIVVVSVVGKRVVSVVDGSSAVPKAVSWSAIYTESRLGSLSVFDIEGLICKGSKDRIN